MVRGGKQQGRKSRSLGQDAMRRLARNNAAVIGGVVVIALFIIAAGAQWIAPYGYTEGRIINNYLHPNAEHLMGCDFMGRDVLSRLMYGARVSLSAALVGAFTSFFIGVTYGLISGFSGGKTDNIMMRFVDIMYGFPTLILIILLMVFFKSTFSNIEPGTFRGALSALDQRMGGMFF
ncbi:ABC transporter permease, partial [Candidatus Bipolaricaulota bacterium]|nr:ABC transporter permease [Candidatus Bipolaricaulota bacterium]